MTQEDKELLLKDLCSRLPYEVILTNGAKVRSIDALTKIVSGTGTDKKIEDTKYYLRPMSSMTEEEAMEYANCGDIIANSPQNNYLIPNSNCVDWLNAHHFDYRGLIDKGLAIEVPEGMYKTK